jgi:hypothetical protein
MKPGDLVRFGPTPWREAVRGRIAVVLDVRRNTSGRWEDELGVEFDVLVDGVVIKDLLTAAPGRGHRGFVGIEILAQSCATAGGS